MSSAFNSVMQIDENAGNMPMNAIGIVVTNYALARRTARNFRLWRQS